MNSYQVTSVIGFVLSGSLIIFALNDHKDLRLTLEERNALIKFKSAIENSTREDFMKSDFCLIRWLRIANLNIPNARNMFLQTIKWREQNSISKIMSEEWSDLEEDYHMDFDGHDKLGRPVLAIDLGHWDLRAAVIHGNSRRLQRYLTYATEKIFQRVFEAQATGKSVTRGMILVNSDGLNIRQHGCPQCIAFLVNWLFEKELHYPSITDETIIINVPTFGTVILNAVRGVMSPEMSSQIKTFNPNKKVWMRYLDERIGRSERSTSYGGTKIQS